MVVIAALFLEAGAARAAAAALTQRLSLPDGAVRVSVLGAAGQPADGSPLVAAFVDAADLADAAASLRGDGGTIIETRPA